jgi:hypothetical protein
MCGGPGGQTRLGLTPSRLRFTPQRAAFAKNHDVWKVRLIESMNPETRHLFDPATGAILDGPADLDRQRR